MNELKTCASRMDGLPAEHAKRGDEQAQHGANGEMLALQNVTASTLQTLHSYFSFVSHSEPGGLHGAGHGNEVDAKVLAR